MNPASAPWRSLSRLVVLASLPLALVSARATTALEEVVKLPEFKVASERPLPKREEWRYVKVGNFEVISSTSDRITREFVKDLREFQIVLNEIAPYMLIRAEQPVMVVLCGKTGQFEQFATRPQVRSIRGRGTTLVRDGEIASIVVDYHHRELAEEVMISSGLGRNSLGDMRAEEDTMFRGRQEVHAVDEFIRQYVHLALGQMPTKLPAWFSEGIANIFSDIDYNNKWIEVGIPRSFRNEYVADSFTGSFPTGSSYFGDGFSRGGYGGYGYDTFGMSSYSGSGMISAGPRVYAQPLYIMPVAQMLSSEGGSRDTGSWRKQVTMFVHMCLYGRGGKYTKGLTQYLSKSATQPVTEELFKECFGKSYKDMAFELRSYSEFTDYRGTVYKAAKGQNILRPIPEIVLRPATDGEIGRIKGETLRLAGRDDAARTEFVNAYLRGDREPQLLGSLGLMARQRGDEMRAKTYLEAVGAGSELIPRPRAYLELARVRSAQFTQANNGGPLNQQQLVSVLTPLFAAHKLPQQLAENYVEIAKAWQNTTVVPQRSHIAVLEQGMDIFPRYGLLVVETARTFIKFGYKAEAIALIQRTHAATRDPKLKEMLNELGRQVDLPPVS
ncbi:MAG TPA: hypothetical protein VGE76_10030 [Opitutaceae bacterium]